MISSCIGSVDFSCDLLVFLNFKLWHFLIEVCNKFRSFLTLGGTWPNFYKTIKSIHETSLITCSANGISPEKHKFRGKPILGKSSQCIITESYCLIEFFIII